ncbi:MAG TPA: tRNA guanosine(34) transglycosylase Tgt, partial [Opitutales bacterium]|nr:tRNA guanosine(34) transglycosylase Tgt [Opitutales bacterium]
FIFCATKAALKGVTTAQAREVGVEIILGNTYHLMLQPGHELVAAHGGLHKFLDWQGPMLTDSGGFQIFSLGYGSVADEIKGRRQMGGPKRLPVKITEEGAYFRSYIDGRPVMLTPERSMEVQRGLGADLVVVLDECTPYHVDKAYTARSMELSHRWAMRSYEAFKTHDDGRQALYGIVQGGVYQDLRKISASFVAEQPFFGQAVGGSLGGSKDQMHEVVAIAAEYLHPERPTHLLGIGGISDLWNGVAMGMDTFDCTHPTRIARHGGALVHPELGEGRAYLNLKNTRFKTDLSPLEPGCPCYCCSRFTRAYLHHLIKADELLAGQLVTLHNMGFMMRMAKLIKKSLAEGTFHTERTLWANV